MAAFVELYMQRGSVLEAVVTASREAEEWREIEYQAVVKIQSWFRGCLVRGWLKYWNHCATLIQTAYRGHLARTLFRKKLKEHLDSLICEYYDANATMIQKTWRGYYVRKYIHNYYAQKSFLAALHCKNEKVRKELEEHKNNVLASETERKHKLQRARQEEEARRCHYMLSTKTKPGVFMHPKRGPVPFEERMKSTKFLPLSRKQHRQGRSQTWSMNAEPVTTTASMLGGLQSPMIDLAATSGDCRVRPITVQGKLQGPFRSLEEVRRQRLRPLNPTLKVMTPFNSVEIARAELKAKEQCRQVVHQSFLPFTKSRSLYDPLLHTQSPYNRPAYGTKHFRQEASHNDQLFRTVVPPIPLFDKLNATY